MVFTHLISDRNDYPGFSLYKEPILGFDRLNIRNFMKYPFKTELIQMSE